LFYAKIKPPYKVRSYDNENAKSFALSVLVTGSYFSHYNKKIVFSSIFSEGGWLEKFGDIESPEPKRNSTVQHLSQYPAPEPRTKASFMQDKLRPAAARPVRKLASQTANIPMLRMSNNDNFLTGLAWAGEFFGGQKTKS
jgi:hypothetical protein